MTIRTTDRGTFKKCRRLWNYSSHLRMNKEPVRLDWRLEFGTAIHKGLEAFYDPIGWEHPWEAKAARAIAAFTACNNEQRYAHGVDIDIERENDYKDRDVLGRGMLQYYCGYYAPTMDKFKPLHVEYDFKVTIGDIVYAGRIDLILEDEYGRILLMDHKTAEKFYDQQVHLDIDTQVSSYAWAAKELGFDVAGVVYNELKKNYPKPPRINENGSISKDRRQSTTYEMYVARIQELGLDATDYKEILGYLKEVPNKFVRRTPLYRSAQQLENQKKYIIDEARDMLDDPRIYPTPSPIHCNSCGFKDPCRLENDGGDYMYLLNDEDLFVDRG